MVPLCGDSFGNFWVVEVQKNGDWGPVFFANHDPPVLVVQAKDMTTFIDQVLSLGRQDRTSAVDEVHDAASTRIWRDEPWGKRAADLHGSPDATVRQFIEQLNADDLVFDLREQVIGSGFAWGRNGPEANMKRCGDELVFALVTPPKRPSLFKRMFGKSGQ